MYHLIMFDMSLPKMLMFKTLALYGETIIQANIIIFKKISDMFFSCFCSKCLNRNDNFCMSYTRLIRQKRVITSLKANAKTKFYCLKNPTAIKYRYGMVFSRYRMAFLPCCGSYTVPNTPPKLISSLLLAK